MRCKWQFSHSIIASVLGHLLLILIVNAFKNDTFQTSLTQSKKPEYIAIEFPKANKKQTENTTTRVVRTSKIEKSDEVDKNAFLGEQNQRVKKQSMTAQETKAIEQAQTKQQQASKKISQELITPRIGKLSKFGMPVLNNLVENSRNIPNDIKEAMETERKGENWAKQGTQSPSEYVQGIENSNQTILNTREFVFFGYFDRIRKRLDLVWSSNLRGSLEKHYRRGRSLATNAEHRTRTLVTLNQAGEIVRMRILEESGTQDLDRAAIDAFNEAGPFPNPPKGIVDGEGKIEFQWEFVLRT